MSSTHSLTEFQQRAPEFLSRLKATGDPVVLTVDGEPEVVVQDARAYQRLLDQAERLETIEAVRSALASRDRGEGRPLDEAFDSLEGEMRSWT